MPQDPTPVDFPELLTQIKKIAELVDPLKAIIAAEAKPDLTERIERFLAEVTRISDQMERAVTAMEANREDQTALQRLEKQIEAQDRDLGSVMATLHKILNLFGTSMDDPERR